MHNLDSISNSLLDAVIGGQRDGTPIACEYVDTHVERVRAGVGGNARLLALGIAFDCGGARGLTPLQLATNGVTPALVDEMRASHHRAPAS